MRGVKYCIGSDTYCKSIKICYNVHIFPYTHTSMEHMKNFYRSVSREQRLISLEGFEGPIHTPEEKLQMAKGYVEGMEQTDIRDLGRIARYAEEFLNLYPSRKENLYAFAQDMANLGTFQNLNIEGKNQLFLRLTALQSSLNRELIIKNPDSDDARILSRFSARLRGVEATLPGSEENIRRSRPEVPGTTVRDILDRDGETLPTITLPSKPNSQEG